MEIIADLKQSLRETADTFTKLIDSAEVIASAGEAMCATLQRGGKILFCGNGGSAADAQHLAAELMGRFMIDRAPLPAIALTVDTSALTAIGNDYGFEQVFSRQVRGLGRPGDLIVGISTSGNSKNVVQALETARGMDMQRIGLTGANGGAMESLCNICIRVPASRTDRIQQLHITVGHLLCGIVEQRLCA